MTINLCSPTVPDGLLAALDRESWHLRYTTAASLYYCVMPDYREIYVGAFGDGSNGAYEWFIWNDDRKELRTSNKGYGCVGVALCHGLVESGASSMNGDHDLVLTWGRKGVA